jgi:diguanylate cyclase
VTLKQTLSLLPKHNISATPTNYAIWYTYLTNESPELKSSIDHILDNKMELSEVKTKEHYRDYLATNKDISGWELLRSLEAMLLEPSQSIKDTR